MKFLTEVFLLLVASCFLYATLTDFPEKNLSDLGAWVSGGGSFISGIVTPDKILLLGGLVLILFVFKSSGGVKR